MANYQTRTLETPTTFVNESDGVWTMADYDRDGIPDLVFIKTSNTPNGHVEVHVASGASNYQNRIFEMPTTFVNESDGVWLMADYDRDGIPDLVFIKTSNTPNGHVEVHIASGASNYQNRIFEMPTTFVNESDGVWTMADYDHNSIPDLVFIKTSNTPNEHVEVHVAPGGTPVSENMTQITNPLAPTSNGCYDLRNTRFAEKCSEFLANKFADLGSAEIDALEYCPPNLKVDAQVHWKHRILPGDTPASFVEDTFEVKFDSDLTNPRGIEFCFDLPRGFGQQCLSVEDIAAIIAAAVA